MVDDIFHYLDNEKNHALEQLGAFLAIPSISTKTEHAVDVARAARWVESHLRASGLTVTLHETAGHPVVFAKTSQLPDRPTVLVYGHYDVQPAEPLDLWTSPPFSPTLREKKVFARGAADDKGQVFVYLKVLEAFARQRGGAFPVNVKLLLEGEEEIGSPNLVPFVKTHRADLACDLILVSDSHMVAADAPSITHGLRGVSCLEISVTTARGDMHSGSYGGAVANPIQVLATLLAACKDQESGTITIPDFYRDVVPLSAQEQRILAAVPHSDEAFARDVGAERLYGEKGYSTLERLGARPTFEVNGIWGGYSGEGVKTVLPAEAHAKISMRLVPHQDPERVARQVAAYLKKIAPPSARLTVRHEEMHGHPVRVAPDFAAMRCAEEAITEVFGKAPTFMLEGGSIPIVADFERVLKRPTILLGFGLPDDNTHAPNEKFDLVMLERGMKTVALLWEKLGQAGTAAIRSKPRQGKARG